MKKIIFATGNKAKIAEMRFIAEHFNFPVEIINGKEMFGDKSSYKEIGDTVEKVAINGALSVAGKIQSPVIVEDTDFRVEALNGEPGIRSGEFLKKFGRREILKRMKSIADRKAVITSAVAYAEPDNFSKVFVNPVKGRIALEEKYGDFPDWISPNLENPFGGGYNAIFIPDGWEKTLAEISPIEAIPWSYRERNFINIIEYILKNKM